jgi:hypothetical protein
MNHFHAMVSAIAIILGIMAGAAGTALLNSGTAKADVDCYTQTTYNGGTRTTCYYGYPDYYRTVTDCDANHCTTRGN